MKKPEKQETRKEINFVDIFWKNNIYMQKRETRWKHTKSRRTWYKLCLYIDSSPYTDVAVYLASCDARYYLLTTALSCR
jgi:hypothetical protein